MSLLRWFSRPDITEPDEAAASSGLARSDSTQPSEAALARGEEPASRRRGERMLRRERLYGVVRECMTNAGLLSSAYRFKVLSLDSRGRQFLVMVDLTSAEPAAGAWSALEAAITKAAQARYQIAVKAVYWRHAATAAVEDRAAA